jgi:hypothetical protein
MVLSSLAHATLATCPACSGDPPDWGTSATAFLEDKPINDIPSGLNSPQQARLIDVQIYSKKILVKHQMRKVIIAVTPTHNSTTMLNIVLNDNTCCA